MGDADLIKALEDGAVANNRSCPTCDALKAMSPQARETLEKVLRARGSNAGGTNAGTIGNDRLAKILTANGYPVGRRSIARHRAEGHS